MARGLVSPNNTKLLQGCVEQNIATYGIEMQQLLSPLANFHLQK